MSIYIYISISAVGSEISSHMTSYDQRQASRNVVIFRKEKCTPFAQISSDFTQPTFVMFRFVLFDLEMR